MRTKKRKMASKRLYGIIAIVAILLSLLGVYVVNQVSQTNEQPSVSTQQTVKGYRVSAEEKTYLQTRFDELQRTNADTVGYVYIPGTLLDEPVVQTTDNHTYLDKTFDGGHQPYMGTVFMDTDNQKNFSDKLTWLFGHARGSQVPDHRMFKTVNYYADQEYFNEHPYVVIETPERKYYYQVAFLIVVPEDTAFYKTQFNSDEEFTTQLTEVREKSTAKNEAITISATDKYLVLSTCLEDDETIRSNLYLRQISDDELPDFLEANGAKLAYKSTRQ